MVAEGLPRFRYNPNQVGRIIAREGWDCQAGKGVGFSLVPLPARTGDVPITVGKKTESGSSRGVSAAMRAAAATTMSKGRTPADTRETDRDAGAFAGGTADGNRSAVLFNDLLHRRQA